MSVRNKVPQLAYRPVLLDPMAGDPDTDGPIPLQPWSLFRQRAAAAPDGVVGEFGIGRAEWMLREAEQRPGTLFLGVESSQKFALRVAKHARQRNLGNVLIAWGDARLAVLPCYVPAGSLTEAHYLFPDPWTKSKHAWRRMLAARNVPFIQRALAPGGILRLRTDVPAYVEDAMSSLPPAGFVVTQQSHHADPAQAITYWEKRKLAEGFEIDEVWFRAPEARPDLRERALPIDPRGIALHEDRRLAEGGFAPPPTGRADGTDAGAPPFPDFDTRAVTIRDLDPSADLAGCHALNQANTPHVSSLDPEAFAATVASAAYARVAVAGEDGRLLGMLLGMTPDADYSSLNFAWFRERYEAFAYCDRVAVAEEGRGAGIGRRLYDDFAAWGRQNGYPLVACEVNRVPPNPNSLAFHARIGFREVGERRASEDYVVAMLMRGNEPTAEPSEPEA